MILNASNLRERETLENNPFARIQKGKLGQLLVDDGAISSDAISQALQVQTLIKRPLGEILVASSIVARSKIYSALGIQDGRDVVSRNSVPEWRDTRDPQFWLKLGMIPWDRPHGRWRIATSNAEKFERNRAEIEEKLGQIEMIWASPSQIIYRQNAVFQKFLVHMAENSLPDHQSCRTLKFFSLPIASLILVLLGIIFFAANMSALTLFHGTLLINVLCLLTSAGTKLAALVKSQVHEPASAVPASMDCSLLPKMSLLIALYKEKDIAATLIANLGKIIYPPTHLQVILVLEADDLQTAAAILETELPPWIEILRIPAGTIKTKPRALNYALPFCSGEIVGVYDAEDAPEPDQLLKVAAQFATAGQDTACLQGSLSFFNARTSYISRCFAIEYSAWFRVFLPGLAKLGCIIPLGGTTLFFRRTILEDLGGWDAHNVTEDADLGVRLARAGYRCEILQSTTHEEATTQTRRWIMQRSRWIKGFMITYWCHMRDPKSLWHDLGPRKFWGLQALFLPGILQVLLAPFLWIFWGVQFGLIDKNAFGLSASATSALSTLFILCFVTDLLLALIGTQKAGQKQLWPWIPLQYFYFPLATVAAVKALYELIAAPFYWEKTQHGLDKTKIDRS